MQWGRAALAVLVTAVLLALVGANIAVRFAWVEIEDGILWEARAEGVVAANVGGDGAGARAGIRPGDVLVAVNGRGIDRVEQVLDAQHGSQRGRPLSYVISRAGYERPLRLDLQPLPDGARLLYYAMAAVAIFALLVGCSVRVQRPRDPATLHFFWLTVAFFGVCGFSYSGRLDRLDWVFYWADVVAMLALPPLFVHFALVFPERQDGWANSSRGRAAVPLLYLPAILLGLTRASVLAAGALPGDSLENWVVALDRAEMLQLVAALVIGQTIMTRTLGRLRSVTARRQLRWIVWGTLAGALPFAMFYGLPYALGYQPWEAMGLLVVLLALVPLAFASAVVRYRLMDVEVIIKRTVVYATVLAAIATIYTLTLRLASEMFLGGSEQHNSVIAILATLLVVLLAPMVKNAIQTALDYAHYRDRYDYRRALLAFARDLNADLDLDRLAERLVQRLADTFGVDRVTLLVAGAPGGEGFSAHRAVGAAPSEVPCLKRFSGIGTRLESGQVVNLDDPFTVRRFAAEEVRGWRDHGLHYFVPCLAKDGPIAVIGLGSRPSGEPLSTEDLTLLNAVAAQVATAIENGRLYQALRDKAEELDRMREFNENVVQSLQDGLLVIDLQGTVVHWNPAMEQIAGVPASQAVGRRVDELFDPEFLAAVRMAERDGSSEAATIYRTPLVSRHADGARKRLVNAAMHPLRGSSSSPLGSVLMVEDITSRVQLEEQLQISEKMASIGLLAAGVAHEVNTPLTGISSFTQMLLENADPEDPRTRLLEKIERQTFRAAKIVNSLLHLSRPVQSETGPVDLHVVINDVLSLLEHQFRTASVQVRKDLQADGPMVRAVEHKLQQVFLNLFLNARDAMPKGGWLAIATHRDGDHVVVEVSDTGAGIPAEHLARIYDPFFSTKPIGQGTGLGLSITYGIVQEHDGTIVCDSQVGQGTRFSLSFPRLGGTRVDAAGTGAG
ncbi:ATP-binding protein [Luteitalea sp.]|uniref:GAF domain-containing sensor histidine kinase n=1 Tax=Luteitalea sp. TaxID=2004800 RepID=UPI0037C636DA